MKRKLLCESLEEFRLLEQDEPLALAVLGAPAGGKSSNMSSIISAVKDARIEDTIKHGVNLTVDVLRDEFKSQKPIEQIRGFMHAFYYIKGKAEENPKEYGKWFKDIQLIWADKLSKLMPSLQIQVKDNELYFQGKPAIRNLKALQDKSINAAEVLQQLDKYQDYKRVVRYFQNLKQEKAIDKQYNVSYDESGDEPNKIVAGLKNLHDKGYVTDVFLIHPENVATNLIQNYIRVLKGGDGGRDSSDAIVQAYLDIQKNKDIYKNNAEDKLKTTANALKRGKVNPTVVDTIKKANVPDDPSRGDKPIDVFTEVGTRDPFEVYNTAAKELTSEQMTILKALLKYRLVSFTNLPKNAKRVLDQITQDINNKQALEILKRTADSKKYIFQYGGVTPDLVKKAETVLK